MTKDALNGKAPIFVIEGGNLEFLMNDINASAFANAKKENGDSKPAIAYGFAQNVSKENPDQLKPIRDLLLQAINLSENGNSTISKNH